MDPLHLEETALARPDTQTLNMPRPYVSPGYNSPIARPENNFNEYLRTIRKYKWTIVASAAIVLVLTTIATLRMTPMYEASARIAIGREDNENLRLGDQSNAGSSDSYYMDVNTELDTQSRILQSDTLALSVIEQLKLDSNPAFIQFKEKPGNPLTPAAKTAALLTVWGKNLTVAKIPRTRMIEMRFESRDANLSAEIVNTLKAAYIEHNFRTRYESTMQASEWLSKQLTDLQIKVETSQAALVRYQKENGIVGIDEKQNTTTNKLDELNKEATQAQGDRLDKQSQYEMVLKGDLDAIPELSQNLLVGEFRKQEGELQKQLADLQTQFGPAYPKVLQVQSQLKEVQSNIKREIDRIASRKRTQFQAAESRERMLQAALDAQKQEANKLSEKAIEYNQLKREADSNRQVFDALQQKLKEAAVTAGLRSSNVHEVDSARVPARPSKPNIPRNLALGLLLGLVGGIFLAFFLEAMDNTVRTPEQVESISLLPSLGIIPLSLEMNSSARKKLEKNAVATALTTSTTDGKKYSASLLTHVRPKSEVAESFRALRTSILLSSIGHAPKVIMLTSSLPQEGKTTTSVNTAIVLAQRGGKVLLVDADMRRPSVHHSFKIRNRAGLSTLLTGSNTADQVTLQTPIMPNLYVIPAGPPPPHPAELLSSQLMKNYIERWRKEYDHVVIDTPPILSVTDAVILSVDVDATVLVIRSGRTTKEALRRSRELLTNVNARVLGVVVNAVDLQSPDAYYYYYGSNYGGRYYDESAHTS